MTDEGQLRTLRIAVCQYEPIVADPAGNLAKARSWAERSVDEGAKLIVLPELASSGYVFQSAAEADAGAAATNDFVAALTDVARRGHCHVVSGIAEIGSGCRHNSAVVIGAAGVIATYRKVHLFHNEQSWFAPGSGLVTVDLPWGRLGILICFDLWFPEATRQLALAGVDVIAVPTNWVSNFKSTVYDERGYCQGNYVALAAAAQNGVVMACADRIGVERGTTFLGASIIVGADGWPLGGPASATEEALLVCDVDLNDVDRARQRTPRNHLLDDRRPDAYNVAVVGVARD